jgi:putative FmdB family regulatory protein
MPRYLYECSKCKKQLELEQSISARTAPLCCEPDCGGIEMESIIQKTTFVLKGPRWAKDGYK